jgi:hypothetical protein
MWFLNHVARPIVTLILRSRFHRLLSARVMVITYTGRRSGRTVAVPVQYWESDDRIRVRVGAPDRKQWWRNFETARRAILLVRGTTIDATGRVVRDNGDVSVCFTPTA